MGNTWEVHNWVQMGETWGSKAGQYHYEMVYGGESMLAALWNFWKTKRDGAHCVKLEWRR